MGNDCRVLVFLGEFDGVERLGQRTDLVHFHEDGVGRARVDPLAEKLDIRHKKIITHELRRRTHRVRQFLPTRPVILRTAVLDRDDRELLRQPRVVGHQFLGAASRSVGLLKHVLILRLVVELTRRDIERDENVLAEFVTRLLHRRGDGFQRIFRTFKIRREPTLVAHRRREPAPFEHALERVENLATRADRLAERVHAPRHHHEFLEIHRRVRVRAAVDDVHHRHGQDLRVRSAEVFVKWLIELTGGRFRRGQRDREDRVRPELRFVLRAIERDHRAVDPHLVERIAALDDLGDGFVHVRHRLGHAFAEVAILHPVAQFPSLVLPGARPARHDGPPDRPARERDFGFDSGIAAGVDDLAGVDGDDFGERHGIENLGIRIVEMRRAAKAARGHARRAVDTEVASGLANKYFRQKIAWKHRPAHRSLPPGPAGNFVQACRRPRPTFSPL